MGINEDAVEACDCDCRDEAIKCEEFNAVKFETEFEKNTANDIIEYINLDKEEKEKDKIRKKVAAKLKDIYFKDGVPDDLPYDLRRLFKGEDEDCMPTRLETVNIPDDEITKLQTKVKEYQTRQTEIIELMLDKDQYLSSDHKNLIGSYVSEYKKLEGIKSNYLDRLQAAYCKYKIGDFDTNFSERKEVDCNHRF